MQNVSRETSHLISNDFIAGICSVAGTFTHTKTARTEQFGFQIKLPSENVVLLEMIRKRILLKTRVKIYETNGTEYAMLISRSKYDLIYKIIPFLDGKLLGNKLKKYLEWKEELISSI